MTASIVNHKALAVWFKNLEQWQVRTLWLARINRCHWPIVPLIDVAKLRSEIVSKEDIELGKVALLDRVSFDEGKVHAGERTRTKMVLYRGRPGDIVVSKINARKRAIGIVPNGIDIATTIHFRILIPNVKQIFTEFLWAALRSEYCRNQFEIGTGGIGKGEISETRLLNIKVPLPPLPIQQTIMDRWQAVQNEVANIKRIIVQKQAELEMSLLREIGIDLLPTMPRKGAFVLNWQELERWDTFFYRGDFVHLEKQLISLGARPLGKLVQFISRPWTKADFPEGTFRYIEISCVFKDEGIIDSREVDVMKSPSRATTIVKTGDLILSTTRPYLGAFAIVPETYNNCVCSSAFAVVDSVDEALIDKDFLLLLLKSPSVLQQMERRMTGGLYPAIVQAELEKILIPIPSLSIQRDFIRKAASVQEEGCKARELAAKRKAQSAREVEEMILGIHPIAQ